MIALRSSKSAHLSKGSFYLENALNRNCPMTEMRHANEVIVPSNAYFLNFVRFPSISSSITAGSVSCDHWSDQKYCKYLRFINWKMTIVMMALRKF